MLNILYGKLTHDFTIVTYKRKYVIEEGTKIILSPTKRGGVKITTEEHEYTFESIVYIDKDKLTLNSRRGIIILYLKYAKQFNNFKELNSTLMEFKVNGKFPEPDKISLNSDNEPTYLAYADIATL